MKSSRVKNTLMVLWIVLIVLLNLTSCENNDCVGELSIELVPKSGKTGDEITIVGKNFSTDVSENTVTFNNTPATVLSATATQLKVLVPAKAGDGLVVVKSGNTVFPGQEFDYIESLVVSTFAGSTSGFADGPGATAKFEGSYHVTTDNIGNVYLADALNNRIRKISPSGVVSTLAGSGEQGSVDGPSSTATFNYPTGVAVDATNNVYVVDSNNNRIRKISPSGMVSTLAGSTRGFADGQGIAAQFNLPIGITVDASGNLYVADGSSIRKITPSGLVSTLIAHDTNVNLGDPYGIVIDAEGNIIVSEIGQHRVLKITPSGIVSILAGPSFVNSQGVTEYFHNPTAVAIDAASNVYVADFSNHVIRKITSSGSISTFAGGMEGYTDGPINNAQFAYPFGIALDNKGNFYVSELEGRIRKISLE